MILSGIDETPRKSPYIDPLKLLDRALIRFTIFTAETWQFGAVWEALAMCSGLSSERHHRHKNLLAALPGLEDHADQVQQDKQVEKIGSILADFAKRTFLAFLAPIT